MIEYTRFYEKSVTRNALEGTLGEGDLWSVSVFAVGAQGVITADFPMTVREKTLRALPFLIQNDEGVDYSAGAGEETLETLLSNWSARRLCELGGGLTRGSIATRATDAPKRRRSRPFVWRYAEPKTLPAGVEAGTDTAVHADLLAVGNRNVTLWIDGDVIHRDWDFRRKSGVPSYFCRVDLMIPV